MPGAQADNPQLAVEAGKALCKTLLEPLHATFGHVAIRSAFRSVALHEFGSNYVNIDGIEWNYARHTWDRLDKNDKKGATASVVIPWFVDYLEMRSEMSWKAMAWWIYDHLRYSEVLFFHSRNFNYAAFNIRWHETDERRWIRSTAHGSLTKRSRPEFAPGAHASEYPGFPTLKPLNEHYPDPPKRLDTTGRKPSSGRHPLG